MSIDQLVPDIYRLLESGNFKIDADKLAKTIARRLQSHQSGGQLRMSNFGTPCDKKLWYTINRPELAEPLLGKTKLNFLMGDLAEEVILSLVAQLPNHKLSGEQDELEIEGVVGHRDAIIDGMLVDVKSANARSFEKFRYHRIKEDDPFGYIDQLSLYLAASKEDVDIKKQAAFLAFNKEKGDLALDVYDFEDRDWKAEISQKKEMLNDPNPPSRGFASQPHNKSGNMKLCTACSYCPFKKTCWPGMRTFLYSSGPVHLVKIEKMPDVPEIKFK